MTVTKETPKKGIKSPLRFILFYNKRIVRKWQMLITPRIMSTKAVDIPKQRVVDVDNYEDYVDKWNTHIHIVFSGDSVGREGIKTELSTSFPHFVDNVM